MIPLVPLLKRAKMWSFQTESQEEDWQWYVPINFAFRKDVLRPAQPPAEPDLLQGACDVSAEEDRGSGDGKQGASGQSSGQPDHSESCSDQVQAPHFRGDLKFGKITSRFQGCYENGLIQSFEMSPYFWLFFWISVWNLIGPKSTRP